MFGNGTLIRTLEARVKALEEENRQWQSRDEVDQWVAGLRRRDGLSE